MYEELYCGTNYFRMDGDPVVYQLIYTSSATPDLDDFALREIAHSSNLNNQQRGITGLLLFHEGSIMQVLEGDEMSVYSLYGKIKQDNRHTGCMILSTRESQEREFSEWFMGYKNVSSSSGIDTLFNLNRHSLANVMPHSPSQELETLTQTYAKVSGL